MIVRTACVLLSTVLLSACVTMLPTPGTLPGKTLPALPMPVTNNAVAMVTTPKGNWLVSFNGLGQARSWSDTLAHTFVLAPAANQWHQASDVPEGQGRLASVAVALGAHAYVFGGYTVAVDHSEVSLPYVHRYDPVADSFKRLRNMPVPVDDAVAMTYQDRYIYVISGWHDKGNVNLVQVYDIKTDTWTQATPYPGVPVFGHAGGNIGNKIVICDGVKIRTHSDRAREFVMEKACYLGVIQADDPRSIEWHTIPAHPGAARYRMAAGGIETAGGVVFAGGSDNPYNYDGTGYNGDPSEPLADILLFDITTKSWKSLGQLLTPTMDHRGLLFDNTQLIIIGGMQAGQQVTPLVQTTLIMKR